MLQALPMANASARNLLLPGLQCGARQYCTLRRIPMRLLLTPLPLT